MSKIAVIIQVTAILIFTNMQAILNFDQILTDQITVSLEAIPSEGHEIKIGSLLKVGDFPKEDTEEKVKAVLDHDWVVRRVVWQNHNNVLTPVLYIGIK